QIHNQIQKQIQEQGNELVTNNDSISSSSLSSSFSSSSLFYPKTLEIVDGVPVKTYGKGCIILEGTNTNKVYGVAMNISNSGGSINPIYVSIGHKVSLDTAIALVKACSLYRIPEPIRQADL